uniref:non-specific serine/threonine protein kinase n=1 Tax=Myripristis murdjan TaxID=586833 RepID=A0A668AIM4_9TELE
MDREPERGGGMVQSRGDGGAAAGEALQQCQLIQNMIDISVSSLQGLRTKCAASNDLTQHEIRTLEDKLTKYFCQQLQLKQRVPERERTETLAGYPRLEDWLRTVNLRPQFIQVRKLSVDVLLQMSNSELQDTMRRLGSNSEECSRLTAALSCLKSATETGGDPKEDAGSWGSELRQGNDVLSPVNPPPCSVASPGSPSTPQLPPSTHGRSISISVVPCLNDQKPYISAEEMTDAFPSTPATPPITPLSKRRNAKPPHTPPPPAHKLLQLLPNITLTRSKSHESQLANNLAMHRSSPQTMRRDFGLAVTHRFSTKSWLSQTCQVCRKSMMFGVKCKHCKLKCHNKCTKEAPSCRISFLTLPRIRRAESVPSDINNQIDRTAELPLQFGTLPKAITKKELPPVLNQLDSSSNPSSATSSTPSSPAPFQQSNPPSVSATPPPNPSPQGSRDGRFHFPGTHPAMPASHTVLCALDTTEEDYPAEDEDAADQCGRGKSYSNGEYDEDELEELPASGCRRGVAGRWRGPISRKASQTSVYLQEWDIPYEQLQLGELIGKGRWGKVHKGRWHGEVAIRLMEVDGNNQDHLKLFKKEVMNYRQTRHENVVLFMGACMAPPHLAIITSFCKGRTLFSVVRDSKQSLDINRTRQVAQEIVKGMGYLHAKGIVHKDLKSKNVFYDLNKAVITDFGLFGMSGVVQEGRRENVLRIPQGWIYYLAPEIVRRMGPEVDEDQLPFSKAADVYAFGTIWYELQARGWPITNQPVEAKIWLFGSGEGIKKVLADVNLGKEVTEILSACWSFEAEDRPSFTQLADMLEKLPKLNRRLSHPGHFWKSTEYGLHSHCPYLYKYSS